jgi:UDP-N-acetylglucosamine 2-epimerase
MRDTTERTEAVETGMVKVVGTRYRTIVDETSRLLADSRADSAHALVSNPYGDGKAASRIVDACLSWLTTYGSQPGGLWGCHGTRTVGALPR